MGLGRAVRSASFLLLTMSAYASDGALTEHQASMDAPDNVPFKVAARPWHLDGLGSHRAIVQVEGSARAVKVQVPWRRRDLDYASKEVIVTPLDQPSRTARALVVQETSDAADIVFFPSAGAGTYALYYLPYRFDLTEGWTNTRYLPRSAKPDDAEWKGSNAWQDLPTARVLRFEARTAFDSFAPMELPATAAELAAMDARSRSGYLVFAEDRTRPVRMFDRIPALWATRGPSIEFEGVTRPNEYYTFQLGVVARHVALRNVRVEFETLRAADGRTIAPSRLTCFNMGGTNWDGSALHKEVDIAKGAVMPQWIGVDVPPDAKPGVFQGKLRVLASDAPSTVIAVCLRVQGAALADRGDSELWRYSRLRWLNSTLGTSDVPVAPYTPVERRGNRLVVLGRSLTVGPNGLPAKITAEGDDVLAGPIRFSVGAPTPAPAGRLAFSRKGPGRIAWTARCEYPAWTWTLNGDLEFDGHVSLALELRAKRAVDVSDQRLVIPYSATSSTYFMGIGHPGGLTPPAYVWHWKGPYDSWWLGGVHGGVHVELRGSSYEGPLQNLYHPTPPETWSNRGKGRVSVDKAGPLAAVSVLTGPRHIRMGEVLRFEFALLITPVKSLDTAWQFRTRFYHNAVDYTPTRLAIDAGANIVNVHHANAINPYINYPFRAVGGMRRFVDAQHAAGRKVKIYDTIRELSNYTAELWPLLALDGEVFQKGGGGGFAWLQEHVGTGYVPSWYHPYPKTETADASMVTAGFSRWINYYVEGLRWLAENVHIDGLYLDDVSYDRRVLKRMRRVLAAGGRPPMIDLHSNTGFSMGPANQYADFFPYVDRLWFGESFDYDHMPADQWLVETSGIPFGLMGEMLQGGGNRWLGMVFGMTTRFGWTNYLAANNPDPIWRFWDRFGIEDARMIGYWEDGCPVRTDTGSVFATVFLRKDRALIAIGNFGDRPADCRLKMDWRALKLDPKHVRLQVPSIENYQSAHEFDAKEPIHIEPKRGWLILAQPADGG